MELFGGLRIFWVLGLCETFGTFGFFRVSSDKAFGLFGFFWCLNFVFGVVLGRNFCFLGFEPFEDLGFLVFGVFGFFGFSGF